MQTILKTIFSLQNTSYWLLVIWAIGAGLLLFKMPKEHLLVQGRVERRWYWVTAIMLVLPYILWAGYRGYYVDTGTYIRHFMQMPSTLSAIPKTISSYEDWGFYCMMVILKSLGIQSYEIFFLILAAFHIWCMIYIFRRYSTDMWISFFMFIASTDYMSWMQNGIRQFTAVCICFAAFELQMRKKYITYTIVVLIASTFHGSALLMLPFSYVMLGSALNKKSFLMIGAVAAMVPMMDVLTPFLESLLADTQYNDVMTGEIWANDDGTSMIRVLVYSVPALISLFGFRYIRGSKDRVANMCINASMITMAVYLISAFTSGIYIGRIPIYTTLHGYVIMPWLIDQIFEKLTARLIKFLLVVFYLAFFAFQMSQWGLL
jgi:hypothetical protein